MGIMNDIVKRESLVPFVLLLVATSALMNTIADKRENEAVTLSEQGNAVSDAADSPSFSDPTISEELAVVSPNEEPGTERPDFVPDDCLHRAFVEAVYDGDTFTADIFLGFRVILDNQKFRLLGIDAPELRGADRQKGIAARNFIAAFIEKKFVLVDADENSIDKYGRHLVVVYVEVDSGRVNVNETMLASGHARTYSTK